MIRQGMTCAASVAVLALISAPVAADVGPLPRADIYVLGEVHDNADTHAMQADIIRKVSPRALVFEMLTPAQAEAAKAVDRSDAQAVAEATQWAESGWPDFAMYASVFAAAPDALIVGAAVPRPRLMQAMQDGTAAALGVDDAALWQVAPLTKAEQQAREAVQAEAHCGALPAEMLPGMVAAQRLRDVDFARVTADAFDETGGPVALITGTGHARKDTGVPSYLAAARPDLSVVALGQFEGDTPGAGDFDIIRLATPADRPDPCAAFAN
jgi:uncharacterized iron-regulated protein